MFEWSEHNITEFVRLHGEGLSFSAIGSELGCSRNACIGKAHRMGLEKRTMGAQPRAERKPRVHRRQRFREVLPMPVEPLQCEHIFDWLKQRAPADDFPINSSGPECTIMDLTHETCRWPLWSDAAPDRLYCGAASAGTYCQRHTKMAWRHR